MKVMRTVRVGLGVAISLSFAAAGTWFLVVDVTDDRGWALLGVVLLSSIVLWGFLRDPDASQT